MKRILLVLVLALGLIAACPVPGCNYINNCTTWHLTGTVAVESNELHIVGTAVVGDIPAGYSPTGNLQGLVDGEFDCITCGVDDTTHTGALVLDTILPSGSNSFDFYIPADTSVPHTITLSLGQSGCANCIQILSLSTDTYVPPIPPVFAQLWQCSDGSNCFNYKITPGPDAVCLLFDRSGVSTFSSIPAWCAVDPSYTGTFIQVQAKWIPLPYGEWLSYQMFYKGK